jgi:hypothetical protein
MPVAFGSASTLTGAVRTNSVLTKPTGLAAGDYIEIWLEVEDFTGTLTLAGWTRVDAQNNGGVEKESGYLFYKIADSTDAAAASFTITHASAWTTGWCARYSGVDNTTPQDATPVTNTGTTGTSTALSVTSVTAGAMVIHHHVSYDAGTGFTPTAGWTERQDVSDMYVQEQLFAAAGASGSTTRVWSGVSHPWATVSVALRPAGSVSASLPPPSGIPMALLTM